MEVVTSSRARVDGGHVTNIHNLQQRDNYGIHERSPSECQATIAAVHNDNQEGIQPSSSASEVSQTNRLPQDSSSKSQNSPQANSISHDHCDSQLHCSNTGVSRGFSPLVPSTSFMIAPPQSTFTNKLVALSTISATLISLATLGVTIWQVQVQKEQQQKSSDLTDPGPGSRKRDYGNDPSRNEEEENLDGVHLPYESSMHIAITVCVALVACSTLGFLMVSMYRASQRRNADNKLTEGELQTWPWVRHWKVLLGTSASLPPYVSCFLCVMAISNATFYYLFTRQKYHALRDVPTDKHGSSNNFIGAPIKYITGLVVCLAIACLLTYASVLSHNQRTDRRRASDVAVSALAKIDYHTRARAQQAHDLVRSYHIQLQEAGWHKWRFWATPIQATGRTDQNAEDEPSHDDRSAESVEEDSPAYEGEIGLAEDHDASPKPEEFKLTDTHMTARSAIDLGAEELTRRFHEHEKLLRRKETEHD